MKLLNTIRKHKKVPSPHEVWGEKEVHGFCMSAREVASRLCLFHVWESPGQKQRVLCVRHRMFCEKWEYRGRLIRWNDDPNTVTLASSTLPPLGEQMLQRAIVALNIRNTFESSVENESFTFEIYSHTFSGTCGYVKHEIDGDTLLFITIKFQNKCKEHIFRYCLAWDPTFLGSGGAWYSIGFNRSLGEDHTCIRPVVYQKI